MKKITQTWLIVILLIPWIVGFTVFGRDLLEATGDDGGNLTNLNGEAIQDNTIDEDSIDWGTGTDQIGGADLPLDVANFDGSLSASDNTVQLAMETLDEASADIPTLVYEQFIPIEHLIFNGSNDPGDPTYHELLRYREFSGTAQENGEFIWFVPEGQTGATVKMSAEVIQVSATSPADGEGMLMTFSACCPVAGLSVDCTTGTEAESINADMDLVLTEQYAIYRMPYVAVTPTNLTAGTSLKVSFNRRPTETEDTYVQDIGVTGIWIKWSENATTLTY